MTARYTQLSDWQALPARQAHVNGIELRVVDHGEGPPAVLVHGFPELGFSWRHQAFALAEAGWRVLIPDLRGYGGSSRPPEADAYDLSTIAADLVGLLDDAGAAEAVFIGHDWGAAAVWHLALSHPGRVRAVAGLSVPIAPRPPAPPIPILRKRLGEDFYMVWFQEPGAADAVLNSDVRRTLLADDILASQWANTPPAGLTPRPFMTEEDLGYFIEAFERTGFTGGLNYYRNIDRNWQLAAAFDGRTIDCPSFFLIGSEDLVAKYSRTDRLREVLTDLRADIVLQGAGHWIQQERAGEVNEALLGFLRSVG